MNLLKRTNITNLLLSFSSLLLCLGTVEGVYRYILFNDTPLSKHFQQPQYFADYFSDDNYWKLYYLFEGTFQPPSNPHPTLGWIGDFSSETLLHNQHDSIHQQRPVLLYGDSFAQCVQEVECFQDILNSDTTFSKDYHLLNYGVGGYGLDQTFLLFQNSVHHYQNTFVIISLMTLDLDRSTLSVRTGQKPYFEVANNELILKGTPINNNPDNFFKNNPPTINSYFYQSILHSPLLPNHLYQYLKAEKEIVKQKKILNEKIILKTVEILQEKKLDYVFLIFHPHWAEVSTLDGVDDWRQTFLKDVLNKHQIPYIWSKDIFHQDTQNISYEYDDYIIPNNGHPTTYFNQLIATEIKKHILLPAP